MAFIFTGLPSNFSIKCSSSASVLPTCELSKSTPLLNELQKLLNDGSEIYNDLYSLGGFENEIKDLHQKREEVEYQYQETTTVNAARSVLENLVSSKSFNNFRNYHECMRNKEASFWNDKELLKSKDFCASKDQWFRQAEFSHFSQEALFRLISILDDLKNVVRRAEKYIKERKNRDNAKVVNDYLTYLNNYKNIINQKHQVIAEVMYARLKTVLESRNYTQYDPLVPLLQKFESLKVKPSNTHYKSLLREPFSLEKAYSYIMRKGNRALRKLSENKFIIDSNSKNIKLCFLQQNDRKVLIPEDFKALIPSKLGILSFFSRNHRERYHFFSKRQDFLFKLVSLNQLPENFSVSWDFTDSIWNDLVKLQRQLSRDLESSLFKTGIFSQSSRSFQMKWADFLKAQKKKMLIFQIQYLTKLAESAPLESFDDNQSNSLIAIKEKIKNISKDIEKELDFVRDVNLKRHWEILRPNILRKLTPVKVDNEFASINNLIKELIAKDEALEQNKFDSLKQALFHYVMDHKDSNDESLDFNPTIALLSYIIGKNINDINLYFQDERDVLPSYNFIGQLSELLRLLKPKIYDVEILVELRNSLRNLAVNILERIKLATKDSLNGQDYEIPAILKVLEDTTSYFATLDGFKEIKGLISDINQRHKNILRGLGSATAKENSKEHQENLKEISVKLDRAIGEQEEMIGWVRSINPQEEAKPELENPSQQAASQQASIHFGSVVSQLQARNSAAGAAMAVMGRQTADENRNGLRRL